MSTNLKNNPKKERNWALTVVHQKHPVNTSIKYIARTVHTNCFNILEAADMSTTSGKDNYDSKHF